MTRRKKLLAALLLIVLCSQAPFIYRWYRLKRLLTSIGQMQSQRFSYDVGSEYADYTGVIHAHSSLGGHSTGSFAELVAAARANNLDFVIMTEHPQGEFDTSAMTLNGVHGGVLFVGGNEVSTTDGDRLLLVPGAANANESRSTKDFIDQQHTNHGLAFAAYPSESQSWQSSAIDGVEVYNLFTNTKQINRVVMFFDGVWSYRSYADLLFANFFTRPNDNLKRWDDAIKSSGRKLVAIAGNDAHSNVGFGFSDATGKQIVGMKLDPYERSFRTVRTHVLIKKATPLTRESLLEAMSLGHCYISFDIFSNASGFEFRAPQADKIGGDEVPLSGNAQLTVKSPLPARFVLLQDGNVSAQASGLNAEFSVKTPGVYRIEAYLDSLPAPATGKPWVISNPIYFR
jgi:hypothetical protein